MFPSILPYNGDGSSAAASIRDIELSWPCQRDQRRTTPLFADEHGNAFTYRVLHTELRTLLTALYGAMVASTFSWHSIRIGLACSLHAAGCPDEVIQLICRWECPASLHVYRQLGVEQNIYWTDKANAATFDALRVNNLPALEQADRNIQNARSHSSGAAAPPTTPSAQSHQPVEVITTYTIPGGTVQATDRDSNQLVGSTVGIFNNFWRGYENDFNRTDCPVVARCCREFRHPDGSRSLTYLVEYNNLYYPIKHTALLGCMSAEARAQLPAQRA